MCWQHIKHFDLHPIGRGITDSIDMSDKVNLKGLILNPHMNGSFKLEVDSYITFSNLPIPLWISVQYNSEHCQQPPFKISTLGDRKVAFLTDNCYVFAEAIFTEKVYGSRDLYFLISNVRYLISLVLHAIFLKGCF